MIKDSGARRKFKTGAVRDIQTGKGRCDLLPVDIIGSFGNIPCLKALDEFIHGGDQNAIWEAFKIFAIEAFGDIQTALLETSIHYEEGANKYAERNWEKGIDLYCYIDSGIRHCLKYYRGDKDERHDRAFCWNMLGALWTIKNKPDCVKMEAPVRSCKNLITPADIKTIQRAFECCYEDSVSHTSDGYKIVISVVYVDDRSRSIWNLTHLIQIEQFAGQVYSRKLCKDIREMRCYLGL